MPIVTALRRCECSANMARLVSQPLGLSEPLERGQSGKAIPAPIVVVNAPRATRTKTHAAATAENAARAGLWPAVRWRLGSRGMGSRDVAGEGAMVPGANALTIFSSGGLVLQ